MKPGILAAVAVLAVGALMYRSSALRDVVADPQLNGDVEDVLSGLKKQGAQVQPVQGKGVGAQGPKTLIDEASAVCLAVVDPVQRQRCLKALGKTPATSSDSIQVCSKLFSDTHKAECMELVWSRKAIGEEHAFYCGRVKSDEGVVACLNDIVYGYGFDKKVFGFFPGLLDAGRVLCEPMADQSLRDKCFHVARRARYLSPPAIRACAAIDGDGSRDGNRLSCLTAIENRKIISGEAFSCIKGELHEYPDAVINCLEAKPLLY